MPQIVFGQCATSIFGPGVFGNGYACVYSNNSDSDVDYYLTNYQATWTVTWSISGGIILSGQGTNHIRVRWIACNVPQGHGCTLYINAFIEDGLGCTYNVATNAGPYLLIPVDIAPSLPPAVISGPDTLCIGQVGYFTAPTYYGWFTYPGATYISGTILQYPTEIYLRYDSVGTYTLTSSNSSNPYGGCITDYTDSIIVLPSNYGTMINGPANSCINDTMLFTVSTSTNTNATWSISTGVILNGQGTDSIEILRTNADTILITVLMSDGQCVNEKTFTNIVYDATLIAPEQICYDDTALTISGVPLGFNRTLNIIGGIWSSTFGDSLFAIPDSNSNTISIIQRLNRNGCILDDTITIDIRQPPFLSLGPDTSFCANSPIVLQPQSSFHSYFWSDSTQLPTLNVSSPGQYHLTVADSIGCSASDTIQISQLVSPFISISSATGSYVMCQSDSNLAITALSNASSFLWSTGSTNSTIYADSTGPYWVETTNLAGCIEREYIYISRANVPNPSPIIQPNGPITLCAGDTIQLNAGASYYSYQWNNGASSQLLPVWQPGLYYATVFNGLGCAGESQMIEVLLDTNSLPIIALVNDTLWSTPAFAYQWRFNSNNILGATNQFFVPQPSGTYDVEVLNSNNCRMISNTQAWFSLVGIEEVNGNTWSLYPNPNQGNFNLEFSSPVKDLEISIFDAIGKHVFHKKMLDQRSTNIFPIQLETLTAGVYFVVLNYEGGHHSMKKMLIRQ